jgi:uncharacterized phage protein gp47/JayE
MSAEPPFLIRDYADLVGGMLGKLAEPAPGQAAITDTQPGSVVRTLVEAFSRELAVAYRQLERVYRDGYIETAEGRALDQVVALLGIERYQTGRAEGLVAFSRATPAPDIITIPAGTPIAGRGQPPCLTIEDGEISAGATKVFVRMRSDKPTNDTILAGKLNIMPRPLPGVEQVHNPEDIQPRQGIENDQDLRERARRSLSSRNSGTVAAIEEAVRALGYEAVEVQERLPDRPGVLRVLVSDENDIDNEAMQAITNAVQRQRPAGVQLAVEHAKPVHVRVIGKLILEGDPSPAEQEAIRAQALRELRAYLRGLGVNGNVRSARIEKILLAPNLVLRAEAKQGEHLLHSDDGNIVAGDLVVGIDERAIPAGEQPFDLELTPEQQSVWLSAHAVRKATASDSTETLKKQIQEKLTQLLTDLQDFSQLSFNVLKEALSPGVQEQIGSPYFELVHDRDGLLVRLDTPGQSAVLREREKPVLAGTEVTETG